MLTRIYVDNYKCLVNFELRLGRINLLLGDNGSGKSTLFEVVRQMALFLRGDLNVDKAFPAASLTRWQQLVSQRFEWELTLDSEMYKYELLVEHTPDGRQRRVAEENLLMNGKPLYGSHLGLAQLYRDDFSAGPQVPFDWTRSGIGLIQPRGDNHCLTAFREAAGRILVAALSPPLFSAESGIEERQLAPYGENFTSWYRFISQEHQGNVLEMIQALRRNWASFDSFSLREAGETTRTLKVLCRHGDESRSVAYSFDELSDGQRMLIALYTILHAFRGLGYMVFLDEPDNYLALREIQPWLSELQDLCGKGLAQAILISHSPEVVDYLVGSCGIWFQRPANGPVRTSDKPPSVDGLKTSEAIARGWQQ